MPVRTIDPSEIAGPIRVIDPSEIDTGNSPQKPQKPQEGFFHSAIDQTPIPLVYDIYNDPLKAGKEMVSGVAEMGRNAKTEGKAAYDMAKQGSYGASAAHAIQALPWVGQAMKKAGEQAPPMTGSYKDNVLKLLASPGAMGTLTGASAMLALPGGKDVIREDTPFTRGVSRTVEHPWRTAKLANEDVAAATNPLLRTYQKTIRGTTVAPLRIVVQELGGAGKEPVAAAMRARNEAVARVEATNAERLATAQRTNAERLAREAEERAKLIADRTAWATKEHGVRQAERGSAAAKAQRETIARAQSEYARLGLDNLKNTRSAAKAALDYRWDTLRKKMDTPRQTASGALEMGPVKSEPILDAINDARKQYLVGSPDDLRIFNDLVGQIEQGPLVDRAGGIKPMPRPLGWQEARTYWTNLGDKMYSGTLPANVWKAMEHVRSALDQQLGSAANARGLGREYAAIKSDWSQYKSDFDDLSNMSTGGGSPLARAVRYQNPAELETLLKGKYGDNLLQRMAKYRNRGAAPQIIGRYRELARKTEAIESPKIPVHPARVTRQVKPADLVQPKLEDRPPEVNPYDVRLRRLEEYAGRPMSWQDFLPPRLLERPVIKSQTLREWVARQPRREIVH